MEITSQNHDGVTQHQLKHDHVNITYLNTRIGIPWYATSV